MASLTITLLLLFTTLSYARIPSNLPENYVIKKDSPNSLPEYDANPTILLPSQNSKPKSFDDLESQLKTNNLESQPIKSTEEDFPESEIITVNDIPLEKPLTPISFRPINRHFRLRRSHPFRLCHHNFNGMKRFPDVEVSYGDDAIMPEKRFKSMKRFPEGEISYGDDAILSEKRFKPRPGMQVSYGNDGIMPAKPMKHFHEGEVSYGNDEIMSEKRFAQVEVSYGDDAILSDENIHHDHPAFVRGDVREIPVRWVKFHRHHHDDDDYKKSSFLFKKHDMFGKAKFKKHFHYGEEEEKQEKKAHEERKEGGFVNRIRKFLNHF